MFSQTILNRYNSLKPCVKKKCQHDSSDGFTLMELCVVLIIISLILSMALPAYKIYSKQQKVKITQFRLEKIQNSLSNYFSIEGKLPCPSALADTKSNSKPLSNGKYKSAECDIGSYSVSNIDRSGITFSSSEGSKSSDEDIVSGFVPVYDLELPREYAYDAWNNRISYHVTLSLTEMSTYNQFSGVIRLNDQEGEIVNWNLGGAQYVLVSNGESGCVEAYEDFQNCQNFHTFLMKKHSQSKDSYYDDFLVYEHFISLNHLKAGKECYLGDILKSNKQNRVNVVPHGRSVKVCNHSFFEDNPASKEDCVTFECLNGKLFEQLIIQ